MLLNDLKIEYSEIGETDIASQLKFVRRLVSSNDLDIIDFHYSLLKNRNNERFYQSIRSAFKKRKNEGSGFLLKKLDTEKNIELLGDVIQILGTMKCKDVLPYIYNFIKKDQIELRYKSIIVLGWIGNEKEIDLLSEILSNDKEASIRGYAATAMRQIWYRLPQEKSKILKILKDRLIIDENEKVISFILLCLQEIAPINLGIKEDSATFKHQSIGSIKGKSYQSTYNYLI